MEVQVRFVKNLYLINKLLLSSKNIIYQEKNRYAEPEINPVLDFLLFGKKISIFRKSFRKLGFRNDSLFG